MHEKLKVTRQRHAIIKIDTWLISLIKNKTHIKATIVNDLFRVKFFVFERQLISL